MSESTDKAMQYLGAKPEKSARLTPADKAIWFADAKKVTARSKKVPVGKSADRITLVSAASVPELASGAPARLAVKLGATLEQILQITDISARTFHRRQAKKEPLTAAESDRVLRVARVAAEAERVFGSAEKANRWLQSDNRILGAVPLALLASDGGSRDVEQELIRIDFGDFA